MKTFYPLLSVIVIFAVLLATTSSTLRNAPCKFNVANIAGKTQAQIAKLYGKPTESTTVKPSGTPCPCAKKIYLGGTLEIVYMNGRADWITINVDRSCAVSAGGYSMQRFDDYAYVKAFTK